MTESVSTRNQDHGAVAALRNDSLLRDSDEGPNLVIPAHDVLEDWAIIHWIEDHFYECESQILALQQRLGTAPAIRRGYRKWLGELVQSDQARIKAIFADIVGDQGTDQAFADDTIVAVLRTNHAESFLVEHEEMLFSQDKQLFRRLIHLVRMACKFPSPHVASGWSSLVQHPVGPVWCAMLRLLEKRLPEFGKSDLPLIVGFIEEASMAWHVAAAYPDGAESMVAIAWSLLPFFNGVHGRAQQKRLLQIIAKFPRCQPERFLALLSPASEVDEGDEVVDRDDMLEIVFSGFQGFPSCRDYPTETIAAYLDQVLVDPHDLGGYQGVGVQPSAMFGLTDDYHPWLHYASAYNGPFMALLEFHPESSLDALVRLINERTEHYATSPITKRYLQRPTRVSIELLDGTQVEQWYDQELWTIYRGRTGPNVLQSALMALEHWLLGIAERTPDELDALLLKILNASNSCAITAVVAAVAAAHTRLSRETVFLLLCSPEFILMDHYRFALDRMAPPEVFSSPTQNSIRDIYLSERRIANQQPHRLRDIETAVFELQFGPDRTRIQNQIDFYLSQIPPENARTEANLDWLMSLRRMDLRHRTIGEVDVETSSPMETSSEPQTTRYIKFELSLPDEELRERSTRAELDHDAMDARLSLLMWGMRVFERRADSSFDPAAWHDSLVAAMRLTSLGEGIYDPAETAPTYIASVCLRDHAIELTPSEFDWCVNTICVAIEKTADQWGPLATSDRHAFEGDIPAANVVAKLASLSLQEEVRKRVKSCLAAAITHPDRRVVESCSVGVGEHLFPRDRSLALRCIHAINHQRNLIVEHGEDHRNSEFGEGRSYEQRRIEIAKEVRTAFLQDALPVILFVDGQFSEDHIESLPIALSALASAPHDALAVQGFVHASKAMVHWWDLIVADRQGRRSAPIAALNSLRTLLSKFVLQCDPTAIERVLAPVLFATDRHSGELELLLLAIIEKQCEQPDADNFWRAWEQFSLALQSASWLPKVDDRRFAGVKLMRAVFLSENWTKMFRPWETLDGNEGRLDRLLNAIPSSVAKLESYVNYLCSAGSSTCPTTFVQLAQVVDSVPVNEWQTRTDVLSAMELLLQRFVYVEPARLKRDPKIRIAVLLLLDRLVQAGSSAGYQMRDDFITPLPVEN